MTKQTSHSFSKLDRVIKRQRQIMFSSALVMVALLGGIALLATPLAA
jgi:hypothetical protein